MTNLPELPALSAAAIQRIEDVERTALERYRHSTHPHHPANAEFSWDGPDVAMAIERVAEYIRIYAEELSAVYLKEYGAEQEDAIAPRIYQKWARLWKGFCATLFTAASDHDRKWRKWGGRESTHSIPEEKRAELVDPDFTEAALRMIPPTSTWLELNLELLLERHEARILDAVIAAIRPRPDKQPTETENKDLVEGFLSLVERGTGRKVTKDDFWTVAGYKDKTEFYKWQRNSSDCSRAARANFNRVLELTPEQFIADLDKKRRPKA